MCRVERQAQAVRQAARQVESVWADVDNLFCLLPLSLYIRANFPMGRAFFFSTLSLLRSGAHRPHSVQRRFLRAFVSLRAVAGTNNAATLARSFSEYGGVSCGVLELRCASGIF